MKTGHFEGLLIGYTGFLLKGGLYGESTQDGNGADDFDASQTRVVLSADRP
jgi:hypothetical protein